MLDSWHGQMHRFTGSGPACPRAVEYPLTKTVGGFLSRVLPSSLDSKISPVVVPWDSRRTER